MDCKTCIELEAENDKIPDCKACGKTDILEENCHVLSIIDLYHTLILKSEGCIDADAIKYVLNLEGVIDQKDYVIKIMTYLNTYLGTLKSKKLNKVR